MKNLLIAYFIILAFSSSSFATWAIIPTEDVVKETDLIVIGTLESVSEYTKDNIDYSEGTILIERVFAGNVKTIDGASLKRGNKIKLKWQNSSFIACPRVEHKYHENKKGIWLLQLEDDGRVSSNYPWRFKDLTEMSEVETALRKAKVRKTSRKIKLIDEASQNIPNQQTQNSDTAIQPVTSDEASHVSSKRNYSPLNALIVALFSSGLYWMLYRSRFKIR